MRVVTTRARKEECAFLLFLYGEASGNGGRERDGVHDGAGGGGGEGVQVPEDMRVLRESVWEEGQLSGGRHRARQGIGNASTNLFLESYASLFLPGFSCHSFPSLH